MADRIAHIRARLNRALAPTQLDIVDTSAQHADHIGAIGRGGHFKLTIRAACFNGKSQIEQHRMVYQAVADLMPGEIHALSIDARPAVK